MNRRVIAGVAAIGCVLGLAGASTALAAAKPDGVVGALGDTTGTAGWYTNAFGQTFTEVTTTFTLPLTGIGNTTDQGGLGGSLCNPNNGDVVDVGAEPTTAATVSTPELYSVGFGWGTLSGDPTTDEDACTGNTFEANGAFTGLVDNVPAGDSVQVRAQVARQYGDHGRYGVWFYGEDTKGLVNFAQFEAFGADGFDVSGPFAEAAAGISVDPNVLAGPAVNLLSSFSDTTATSGSVTGGLGVWNAVSVSSSADGQAPWLLTPSGLTANSGSKVCHLVWINGYWGKWFDHHKKRNWHKGHWKSVCSDTKDVSSSFQVLSGTKTGL